MILKKIKLHNIRSYKDAEVVFPEGSTLMMGDVGSGKTSVLLAIEFALFGLQPGQKGNALMRNNEEEASVVLEIQVDDQEVSIERSLKKSGKSLAQSDCSITINNNRTEGSVTEIKNKILTLLSYPPEFAKKTNDLYRFTVYTPQEEMKQIVLESNDVRLNTLRHVFGIDKYKRIEENMDILTMKLRQEIRVKEAEMGNTEQKNQLIKEKQVFLDMQKTKILNVEKEIEGIRKIKIDKQLELEATMKKMNEKNKLENEKDKGELTLSNKKEMINNYEKEIRILNEQVSGVSSLRFNPEEIDILKTRIKTQEQLLKQLNDEYISVFTLIQNNEHKIRDLTFLNNKISSLDKCTTCLQIVNEEHKHNIVAKAKSDIAELEAEREKGKVQKEELSQKIEQAKKTIDSLKQSVSQMEILKIKLESVNEKISRINLLKKQCEIAFADMDMIKKHIESLAVMIKEFEAYEKIYEQKNREFREIQMSENSAMIRQAEIKKEIQFLDQQILQLQEEIKRIQELEKKLNYMKEIEYWLNSKLLEFVLHTEKNVMLKLREEFSNLFSSWFSIIVPEAISVRLDESFSPIIQQADYEVEYNFLSGGERTAVALAYRLALNQVINSLLSKIKTRDLVILDEPTDGFSEAQLDRMRDVFHQLNVRQLVLVSHEQKIEGFVNNIIKFKKTDGITEVEK